MNSETDYLKIISNLETDTSHPYGINVKDNQAPHKPILLLSIIDLFARRIINNNLIELTKELEDIFFTYWSSVMGDKRTTISLPFFHLRNEPENFWRLIALPDKEDDLNNPKRTEVIRKSVTELRKTIYGAKLNDELYKLIKEPNTRKKLRDLIIDTYFSDTVKPIIAEQFYEDIDLLEETLNDFEETQLQKEEISETEKIQLINARRGQGLFRFRLEQIEKGCRLTGVTEKQFLIASHIKPWQLSKNTERLDGNNGLLLSPHVDKLFDKGLITFLEQGQILCTNKKINEIMVQWKLDSNKNIGSFNRHQNKYLDFHRKYIFGRTKVLS